MVDTDFWSGVVEVAIQKHQRYDQTVDTLENSPFSCMTTFREILKYVRNNNIEVCFLDSEGYYHHDHAPAVVNPCSYQYLIHGMKHRVDGPCEQIFTRKGELVQEAWRVDGRKHRVDGPASTMWLEANKKISSYFIDGIPLSEEQFITWKSWYDDGNHGFPWEWGLLLFNIPINRPVDWW